MGRVLSFRKSQIPEIAFSAGDIASVATGDGKYGVMKIIAVDAVGVHARLYAQRFANRPGSADIHDLSVVPFGSQQGHDLSLGHLPLTRRYFSLWQPLFIINQPLTDEDLQGYRKWLNSGDGYF